MLTRSLAAGMILALSSGAAASNKKECSVQEAQSADAGMDRLRNWADFHRAFKDFSHCDDGHIAEGWSDKVVEMLASQWKTLPQLNAIAASDPAFSDFVIRHIDESASWTSAQAAERQAKTRCPKQAAALCLRIEKR